MKPKYWTILVLGLVTVALVIIYTNQPVFDLSPVVVYHKSHVPAPAAPQTDLKGWKTYTNSQYGFSFEYPSELVIFHDSGDATFIQDGYASTVNIRLFPEISNASYYPSEEYPPVKLNKVIINDRAWFFKIYSSNDCVDDSIYQTNMPSGGIVQFEFGGCLGKTYKNLGILKDKLIISQILSTFKFPKSPVDTSDISTWKTYKNDEYGFEFKYKGEEIFDCESHEPDSNLPNMLYTKEKCFEVGNIYENSYAFLFSVEKNNSQKKSVADWMNQYLNENFAADAIWKKILVDGLTIYEVDSPSQGLIEKLLFKNSYIYNFTYEAADLQNNPNLEIFNSTVNSFKFTK